MPEPMNVEATLSSLRAQVDWPATPDVRAQVRRRITARPAWHGSRWALAAAAMILILAALLAYAPTRTAIAEWINLHTSITRTSILATPSPLPPGPLGKRLGLGSPATLDQARTSVRWTVLLPSTLGTPDEVYLQPPADAPAQGEVSLVYSERPGIPVAGTTGVSVLVTEARGSVNQIYFQKMAGPGTTVEPLTIGGHSAWWISGSLHDFVFVDANGDFRTETERLATNTLVIDEGGTIVRIEGDLTRQQALDLAASLA